MSLINEIEGLSYLEKETGMAEEYGFQIVVAFLFPPALPVLVVYHIFFLHETCADNPSCDPSQLSSLDLMQGRTFHFQKVRGSNAIPFLISAAFLHMFTWWIVVQMMDIAERRGNPYNMCNRQQEKPLVTERCEADDEVEANPHEKEDVRRERDDVAMFMNYMRARNVEKRIVAVEGLTKVFKARSFL